MHAVPVGAAVGHRECRECAAPLPTALSACDAPLWRAQSVHRRAARCRAQPRLRWVRQYAAPPSYSSANSSRCATVSALRPPRHIAWPQRHIASPPRHGMLLVYRPDLPVVLRKRLVVRRRLGDRARRRDEEDDLVLGGVLTVGLRARALSVLWQRRPGRGSTAYCRCLSTVRDGRVRSCGVLVVL